MTPFWYGWPSWRTEVLGGAALVTVLQVLGNHPYVWLGLATSLSLFYEFVLDDNPNGKLTDVSQRQVGIALACVLWSILR